MSAKFVTLTYDTDHVPISKNGFMTLLKTDLQKFFKRLRKLHDKNTKIKYYAAGEYGTGKKRPHYHIILFNADAEYIERAWALDNKRIGNIHIGDVTEASVSYTLKYVCKQSKVPEHARDDRQKEFALMSKGMGKDYLSEQQINWHKSNLEERAYIPLRDGKKIAMPKYYKDKMYNEKERKKISEWNKNRLEELDIKLREELGEDFERIQMETKNNIVRKHNYKSEKRQKL